ncbi:MAG TPA: response regulator [Longimicrobiaceae bacterium]|nr:response regulator [Longimicrobiaceae bacterium]
MPSERKKLLVVEDSPMMCRMYRIVLAPAYDLVFAADGSEGLDAAAREDGLDLLVVDVNMPRMDGLEFIRRLRGELGMTEVPVLVCSTEAAEGDRALAESAGANGFLPKPWRPEQLKAAVHEQLGEAP